MGFETVVRPVVMPDIRPAPAQSRSPADDPTQGLATINGSSGQFLDLQYSWTASSSESRQVEQKRRVDEARVYQMDDNDEVNKDNFIDVQATNKMWMKNGPTDGIEYYSRPFNQPGAANIEIKRVNVILQAIKG